MAPQAVQRGHSTARMAGYCAKKTNATLLALTHFSHRFRDWSKDVDLSTTQHLVVEAQRSFGRRAVIAASDFLRIPIPRRPHIQS
jgi:ribonuclease BN (tRNA processing enzyme)